MAGEHGILLPTLIELLRPWGILMKTCEPVMVKTLSLSIGAQHIIWVGLKIGYIPNEIAI